MNGQVESGKRRIEWARAHMKVLGAIATDLKAKQTFQGLRIGMALHVEAKTAVLALTLREAGAAVRLASCNPLSTDDSVAQALRESYGLETYARKGESREEYYGNLNRVLDFEPHLVIDDGGDLIFLLHTQRQSLLPGIIGGNEETTTGVVRLKAMAAEGKLAFPVIDVNDAHMKYLFDNRYGTGQSTMDGIMSSTNLLLAGKRLVVAGYGWCGRGIAWRARGLGAIVSVTEVDAIRAVEATLDGFPVLPMKEAMPSADLIITATGVKDVLTEEHLALVKDGCLLANSGHFDNEISKSGLERLSNGKRTVRENVEEFAFPDGRKVYLLADGRLVNLVAGQGHPAEIMDMSFSVQALAAKYLVDHRGKLAKAVHQVPAEVDQDIARLRLTTWGIHIDALTQEQSRYRTSWHEGT